jgi:hypothetical protein
MAKYYKDGLSGEIAGIAVIVANGTKFIPLGNSDYANLMAQVEAGELVIQEADP